MTTTPEKILTTEELTEKFLSVKKLLFRYCLSKLSLNHDDAQDLISEVYEKALNNRTKFKPETNFNGWCFTITRNLYIDRYRVVSKNPHTSFEPYIDSKSVHNDGEYAFIREDIDKALNSLNEKDRKIADLFFIGYKYEDISENLNIPLGTIKGRIHEIRYKMSEQLKAYR